MEKVFEALKNISIRCHSKVIWGDSIDSDLDTVKQALTELKAIKNIVEICKKANEQKYVYIKETYGIIKEEFLDNLDYEVLNNRLYVNSRGIYYDFPLKDYGIWWALTKEELANGKSI